MIIRSYRDCKHTAFCQFVIKQGLKKKGQEWSIRPLLQGGWSDKNDCFASTVLIQLLRIWNLVLLFGLIILIKLIISQWLLVFLKLLDRLWRDVTYNLKQRNIEKATEHKYQLEQQQREEAKQRKDTGTVYETRVPPPPFSYCIVFNWSKVQTNRKRSRWEGTQEKIRGFKRAEGWGRAPGERVEDGWSFHMEGLMQA